MSFISYSSPLGNYMNSSKRGPAYGFKLSSLDSLCDTKSAKKKLSLLHYIQETVRVKFSDLNNFDAELRGTDTAAQGKSQTRGAFFGMELFWESTRCA